MSYLNFKSLSDIDLVRYGNFRLCYIDHIEEEIYVPLEDRDFLNPSPWAPNPEFISGEQEHYAYFTPSEYFDDQWGDDWNDAPYEHNAGCPYDDIDGKEYEIIRVPFQKPTKLWVKFPDDYGCGNSPFSVEDINSGAVAWMYGKSGDRVLCIRGGEYLSDFKKKIENV